MTKTEYRSYLSSEKWLARRSEFLANHDKCANCSMPRWLAAIIYDQDLHVHHLNYQRVGEEEESDLLPLCKRCHEIETFGRSDSRDLSTFCTACGERHWDKYSDYCLVCESTAGFDKLYADPMGAIAKRLHLNHGKSQWPTWKRLLLLIVWHVQDDGMLKLVEIMIEKRKEIASRKELNA